MPRTSTKRDDLLRSGKDLVLSKGFAATSVEEICEAAGVTKGAFFHYFKSKVDYGMQLLDYTWEPMHQMQARERGDEALPLDQLHDYIDFATDFVRADARLMGILMQELRESNPEVARKGQGVFGSFVEHMHALVAEAKNRYAPDADFDTREVNAFIIATIEGIPTIVGQMGEQHVDPTLKHLKGYLDILFHIQR